MADESSRLVFGGFFNDPAVGERSSQHTSQSWTRVAVVGIGVASSSDNQIGRMPAA